MAACMAACMVAWQRSTAACLAVWFARNCRQPNPPAIPLNPVSTHRCCCLQMWMQEVAPVSNRRAQRLAAQLLQQQQHDAEAEEHEEEESEEEHGSAEPSTAAAGASRAAAAEVEEPSAPTPALPDDQMLRVGGCGCSGCGGKLPCWLWQLAVWLFCGFKTWPFLHVAPCLD